jgi:hypothetical protein
MLVIATLMVMLMLCARRSVGSRLSQAEGPVIARVRVPVRAHDAALDLSTELYNDFGDYDVMVMFVMMMANMMC